MKTYILFLFSNFQDHEDVEFFCLDILGDSPMVSKIRYIIEDTSKSVVVIFDSDSNRRELSEEIHKLISVEDVKFYFLFERDSIFSANLPVQMKDFIFKPLDNLTSLRLEYDEDKKNTEIEPQPQPKMDLDEILEKIEKHGIEKLTSTEKKFLDDFRN